MKTLLKNGLVYISEDKKFKNNDILINNEKIEKVDKDIIEKYALEINCEGKYIIPGAIDPHTHLDHDLGNGLITIDNFNSGTKAALHGGTTCIVDHVAFGDKTNTLQNIIKEYHKKAKNSYIDYSFHGVAFKNSKDMLKEISDLKKLDISSLKLYTVYDEKLEDKWILEVLKIAKEKDIVVCVHCENEDIINYTEPMYDTTIKSFPLSRPKEAEAEMVERLIYYSKITGYPKLYFVHISSKESLEHIVKAKKKGHKNLYIETCVQYLIFKDDVYNKKDGGRYICSPPIRKQEDVDFLWDSIENDLIDVISTDHCSFDLENKIGIKNYKKVAGGVPGIEERVVVILSEAINRNIPLEKVIDKITSNPARIFNLKNKGELKKRKDADIVILKKIHTKFNNIHGKSMYSLYEDMDLEFCVDTVYIRGQKLIENNKYIGEAIIGKFIKR